MKILSREKGNWKRIERRKRGGAQRRNISVIRHRDLAGNAISYIISAITDDFVTVEDDNEIIAA